MKHRWVILIALVLATAVGFGIWRWNEKQAHDRMLTAVDLGGHSDYSGKSAHALKRV